MSCPKLVSTLRSNVLSLTPFSKASLVCAQPSLIYSGKDRSLCGAKTFSLMAFSMMTLSIITLDVITDFRFFLNVIMLSVNMLNVVVLSVVAQPTLVRIN